MSRSFWPVLALIVSFTPAVAHAAEGRVTPGLMLDTGARHSTADGVAFSPDGRLLYAWGEDKVLRRWRVNESGFLTTESLGIRWPVKSGEPRGSIFAFAQTPKGEIGAIGGFGWKDGLVILLDLKAGRVNGVVEPTTRGVVWSMAFTPDGQYLVYGNAFGEVFRVTVKTGKVEQFSSSHPGKAPAPPINRVRLVAFTSARKFISVAGDGVVRSWDVTAPKAAPAVVGRFTVPNILRAVVSPDQRWVAASGTATAGTAEEAKAVGTVQLLDLSGREAVRTIRAPLSETSGRAVRCLAFDADSRRLAVGFQDFPKDLKRRDFFRLLGGTVAIYQIPSSSWSENLIRMFYRPEVLAFNPKFKNQLAVGGGEDHELTLYEASTGRRVPATAVVRSPGSCIWGVAFDRNSPQFFGWREQRNRRPTGRSDLGAGEWRVFDRNRREVLPTAPGKFTPTEPILTLGGWSIEPTDAAGVWEVVGPGGTRVALRGGNGSIYNNAYNQEPRCWTFIPPARKGDPIRLAIGHQWGASVYECSAAGVKLARVLNGHEGEVMCVAASADGKLLLTGSRDQTICCWSLSQWPAGTEMGASFGLNKDGKIVVQEVDKGSPAWEALNPRDGTDNDQNRLKKGDILDIVVIANEKFAYDGAGLYAAEAKVWGFPFKASTSAAAALKLLRDIKPSQQYILGKRVGGKGPVVYKLTTVRQRPLWRMFTTRSAVGREWVIWRPKDYFYDTSVNGDSYVGWHVNSVNLAVPPAFHPLEHYRGTERVPAVAGRNGFHRPDKIWPNLTNPTPDVESVIFTDIEAPEVTLATVVAPAAAQDMQVRLNVTSPDPNKPGQTYSRVVICVNDTELDDDPNLRPDKQLRINNALVTIPRTALRWGNNTITARVFNQAGGRGEASVTAEYTPPGKPKARLLALCVGINDYGKAKMVIPNLVCSIYDAADIEKLLREHDKSKLFGVPIVKRVNEADATAANILKELEALIKQARPDDQLVIYLSGHGLVEYDEAGGRKSPKPGSYRYVTRDYDPDNPKTHLTSRKLFTLLASACCRKFVILDTCHSGGANVIPSDLARDVSPDGLRFLVMASCQFDQECLEPRKRSREFPNGFFTHALLDKLTRPGDKVPNQRQVSVTSKDLQNELPVQMGTVLRSFDPGFRPGGRYSNILYQPAFLFPKEVVEVLCKPARKE